MDDTVAQLGAWGSYPKVYALGHAAIRGIFEGEVIVEEKIDGSQFSFGKFGGEIRCRSKGAVLNLLAPDNMFKPAVNTVHEMSQGLRDGWTYRAEFLSRPKHNTLVYDRVPRNFLIGFDINTGKEEYLSYEEKRAEFERIGLECVPILHRGTIENFEIFRELLDTVSVLGGQKVEGVVVKNYSRFSPDGKAMIGKFVSEAFKEKHSGDWRERHPGGKDVLMLIAEDYTSPARWDKAIQHLRERGELEGSPRDIGKLVREVPADIRAECEEEIKERLFDWAWKNICRSVIRGLPEYYKERLAEQAFEGE